MNPEVDIHPPDQENRLLILADLDSTMLVEAAAGTGKTTSMVGRMVRLLAEGRCSAETLVAVTFTRKAAAELRTRFQVELERQAEKACSSSRGLLIRALEHVERCFIGTIHSFCARMLRERPLEAGLDVNFTEIGEMEDQELRSRAWNQYVAGLYEKGDPLTGELEDLGVEIGQLEPSFEKLTRFPDVEEWPAVRLKVPDIEPAKKALAEFVGHMEKLASLLPDDTGTDKLIPQYRLIPMIHRQARGFNYVHEFMDVLTQFKPSKIVNKVWPGGAQQAAEELERWNSFREDFAEPVLKQWREYRYEPLLKAILPAKEVYGSMRRLAGKLNYQDLLMFASKLLRDNDGVRRCFRNRFTHLLIDEFQDTDPIQAEIMMLLTSDDPTEKNWRRCRPRKGSLFVVGDPKQSIYRFRRADIVTYNQVKEIIVASGGKVINLSANFRTTRPLVEWINKSFRDEFERFSRESSPKYVPLEEVRRDQPNSDLKGVKVIKIPKNCTNKDKIAVFESDLIARTIRNALDRGLTVSRTGPQTDSGEITEVNAGDFLVITPRKSNLALYGRKLAQVGVDHQVTGGTALNTVKELSLLHTCLTALVNPENPIPLVAVLRGELFGMSDPDLYAFKRAGGTFCFLSKVPESLESPIGKSFNEAFQKLRAYRSWMDRMPAINSVERIMGDLGLAVRAAGHTGGNSQAGGLMKALELARSFRERFRTLSDVIDYLGRLVSSHEPNDALPALAGSAPETRVMNLHKVKGLEAPVVFLADPTGEADHKVEHYVDRTGDRARGYLAIRGTHLSGGHESLLAQPLNWDQFSSREREFQEAERLRLQYVAATRAGCMLSISQRERGNEKNPWAFFRDKLNECGELQDQGAPVIGCSQITCIGHDECEEAMEKIRERWSSVKEKSYESVSVKTLTVASKGMSYARTEHGLEWGSVIHRLLQTAMTNATASLESIAQAACSELGLEHEVAEDAVNTARLVANSDIWKRATGAKTCLVEVPFQIQKSGGEQSGDRVLLLRGIIDLVFEEPPGWVVVDYKSDRVTPDLVPELVRLYASQVGTYARAWEKLTGQRVHEAGLYFTHLQKYVRTHF